MKTLLTLLAFMQFIYSPLKVEETNIGFYLDAINIEDSIETIDYYNEIMLAKCSMEEELNQIESIGNREEWFIEYKNIVNKYKSIIDTYETIYDYLTEDEIYLVCRTVETECFEQDFDSKCNVASVIFNRMQDCEDFPFTIEEVVTKPYQFCYWRTEISDDTKLAVEYAFEIEDTTLGCVGFHSNKKTDSFCGWDYQFTDEAGHHFYKKVCVDEN